MDKTEKIIEKQIEKKLWSKTNMIILVLSVLLVLTLGYIGAGEYNKFKSEKELELFQRGVNSGSQQIIQFVVQQGVSCQPLPVTSNNVTVNVIPLECVHARAASCQALPLTFNNLTVNVIAAECIQQNSGATRR